MAKFKKKLYASDIVYLDPLGCGSTIGFKICKGRGGLYADVDLSDCSRKIEWYFSNDSRSVAKIDKAIEMFQRFKLEFIKARRKRS